MSLVHDFAVVKVVQLQSMGSGNVGHMLGPVSISEFRTESETFDCILDESTIVTCFQILVLKCHDWLFSLLSGMNNVIAQKFTFQSSSESAFRLKLKAGRKSPIMSQNTSQRPLHANMHKNWAHSKTSEMV